MTLSPGVQLGPGYVIPGYYVIPLHVIPIPFPQFTNGLTLMQRQLIHWFCKLVQCTWLMPWKLKNFSSFLGNFLLAWIWIYNTDPDTDLVETCPNLNSKQVTVPQARSRGRRGVLSGVQMCRGSFTLVLGISLKVQPRIASEIAICFLKIQ